MAATGYMTSTFGATAGGATAAFAFAQQGVSALTGYFTGGKGMIEGRLNIVQADVDAKLDQDEIKLRKQIEQRQWIFIFY